MQLTHEIPRRTITVGTQLQANVQTGQNVTYAVVAIRYSPFCYVEVEPLTGGPRRTVPLRVAENMLRDAPQPGCF